MSAEGVRLTKAQDGTLRRIEKRDYTAGEPRADWFNPATMGVLYRLGLVEDREGSRVPGSWVQRAPIVDITPAGRAALTAETGGRNEGS